MTAASLDELGRRIVHEVGMPKDAWEIAAQLEVRGLRDSDARSGYGARDLFDLAKEIDARYRSGAYGFSVEGEDRQQRVIPAIRFLHRYFAGIAFTVPMLMQGASMLLWGYGIWGAVDLELIEGSAIALGFILSYVAAGGFAQAIVRRGFFYMYQQEEGLARWTALRGFGIAMRAMLWLLAAALLLNLLFRALPWAMVLPAALFYLGLAVLWLSWALLYLVGRTELLLVITALALAAVMAAARLGGLPPLIANAIGVMVADILSLSAAVYLLHRLAKRRGDPEPVNPPRLSVLIFSTSRYFIYGLLFNLFLFTDRVLAWTTPSGRPDFPPYPFWLSVRYELAMDLALLVVIVMSGVVQYAIERFSEKLIPHEKRTKSADGPAFIRAQIQAHRRRTMHVAIAAAVGLAVASSVFVALQQVENVLLREAVTAIVTLRVFIVAAVAYAIFMFGVRNLLLLLTVARVDAAVRIMLMALTVDLIVGFFCSRAIGYWAAVFGLLAGSIVLVIVAARETRRVLNELDYAYYAAY